MHWFFLKFLEWVVVIDLGSCRRFEVSGELSRTDGSGLDHVADGEALDGLVLGGAASAVGATHRLDVAAAILVAAAIKSISYRAPLSCESIEIQSPILVRQCA